MSDRRTVQVVINVTVDSIGACHWFVTSQEELETVTWTDDGQALYPLNATDQAIECARSELRHLLRGGQVRIAAP